MRYSGSLLVLSDLRSAGGSLDSTALTGSTGLACVTGSTASAVSVRGVDCSQSSLGMGSTGMLEGSFLKNDTFLVTVCSSF